MQPTILLRKKPTHVFPCAFQEIIQNMLVTEHLRAIGWGNCMASKDTETITLENVLRN